MRLNRVRLRSAAMMALSPIVIVLVWALSARYGWTRSVILPSPLAVIEAARDFIRDGYGGKSLWLHLGASGYRVGVAFILGAFAGIGLGILRASAPTVDALLAIPTEVIRPIPPLGLIPLFILWFGVGELSKVILIFIPVLLITMINTQAGVEAANPELIRAANCFGASRLQTYRWVLLPAALPQIFTGLRIALGTGLSVLVAAELLGADSGLGFIILDASNFFKTPYVLVGIALIGLIGLLCDRGLMLASKRLAHWDGRS